MIGTLARRDGAVYLLLAAYFSMNALLRIAGSTSLELDEGQQLFFAQWLVPGYGPQPPFYNWLQYGMVQLLGPSLASLALLKNGMLFLGYLLFGLTAQIVLRDRVLAVVATLGLITVPQIAYVAQRDLTHSVALLFASGLFVYAMVRTLQKPTVAHYALVGLAVAIGMMSKYNFALLPASALVALAVDKEYRARLVDPRMLVAILVACVAIFPHALWFLSHMDEATGSTWQKMHRGAGEGAGLGTSILALLEALASATLPTLAIFYLVFGKLLLRAWSAQSQWTRLFGRIFVAAIVLILLLIATGAASYIRHRWLIPLTSLLPLYLAAKIEASGETLSIAGGRRFAGAVLAIMVAVPLLLFARPYVNGMTGDYGKRNVPYGEAVEVILQSRKEHPAVILVTDHQIAGNLRLHAPDIPVTVPGFEFLERPFQFDADHPILAIWRNRAGDVVPVPDEDMIGWLGEKGLSAETSLVAQHVAIPYQHGREGDVYHFNYAWIYPAGPKS